LLPPPFTEELVNRLECLRLRTRRDFLGSRAGSYASPRRGTSLEFADYRRYSPGDDLRYLDWGVYARTDRLYLKLFREEVDLFVYLFVDASASMAFPSAREKFTPACHVALALAYVVLANHDHVKLHLLQETAPAASPFYQGRYKITDLVCLAAAASAAGKMDMGALVAEHLKKLRRPGKAILLSDFLMPPSEYQRGLNVLRGFNLDISIVQVLSRAELEPSFSRGGLTVVDSESGEEKRLIWSDRVKQAYRRNLERHNREIRSFCHQAGIQYSLFVTDQDLADYVLKALPAVGLFK
jgi:uncharacterized protein (DUF58 family)